MNNPNFERQPSRKLAWSTALVPFTRSASTWCLSRTKKLASESALSQNGTYLLGLQHASISQPFTRVFQTFESQLCVPSTASGLSTCGTLSSVLLAPMSSRLSHGRPDRPDSFCARRRAANSSCLCRGVSVHVKCPRLSRATTIIVPSQASPFAATT